MAWTLTTSGAAIIKAGVNANQDIIVSGVYLEQWSNQAEGAIVAETRRNWVSQYSTLSSDVKNILSDVCSSLIAKQIVTYDMSGYSSNLEAQTVLDIQHDIAKSGMSVLKDFKSNTIKDV